VRTIAQQEYSSVIPSFGNGLARTKTITNVFEGPWVKIRGRRIQQTHNLHRELPDRRDFIHAAAPVPLQIKCDVRITDFLQRGRDADKRFVN
jgi:hypothetical protein